MQPLKWYFHRVRTMPPEEIAWRVRSGIRDAADRVRIPLGIVPRLPGVPSGGPAPPAGFETTDIAPGAWSREPGDPGIPAWSERLKRRADDLLGNRLTFFSLEKAYLGDPIDWHRDHESGKEAPRRLSQRIDYRDFGETGDAKAVWEPNRHHHLVVLGRAYRAFGDPRYADAVVRQIDSWIDANPFGYGMNWRSPLELGIRIINWVWALDLVRDHGDRPPASGGRVREAAWRHLREISRKYSRGSSANNHLIGEAAGVFVGSAYFADFPGASRRMEESREILTREILLQTCPDGCTREQALGYHLFVLQFLLVAGIVGRKVGMDFPPGYWGRLEKMLEFAAALSEGGTLPMFGDCDDGYVLDLAGGGSDARELLAAGSALLGRPDLMPRDPGAGEASLWLLGAGTGKQAEPPLLPRGDGRLVSKAFPESGFYLLQRGARDGEDRVSVLFDCAELGYGPIAAHGHADALSFTLRVGGREVFVDPGTFDYFAHPRWRTHFRSTASHNTLEIDGSDQSVMLGPFLWGARANARCDRFDTEGEGGIVSGGHDGYGRLPAPARHTRTIGMDARSGDTTVTDEVSGDGEHAVRIFFHTAEGSAVRMEGPSTVRIEAGHAVVLLDADPALEVSLVSGAEEPIAGWVSRGYHRKEKATTIVARGRSLGNARFRFRIRIVRGGISDLSDGGTSEIVSGGSHENLQGN